MIERCVDACANKAHTQDQLHGQGNRVLNEVPKKDGTVETRCTVCGNKKTRGIPGRK